MVHPLIFVQLTIFYLFCYYRVIEKAITNVITNNLFGDEDDTEAEESHKGIYDR